MNKSILIAGVIALGTVAWVASGQLDGQAERRGASKQAPVKKEAGR